MTIRLATVADANSIAAIHIAAWRMAYAEHMPADFLKALTVEDRTEAWKHALEAPGPGITIVLEQAQQVIGFCVYGPSRDADALPNSTGELLAINLHPLYWRRGLGTTMCQYVLADGEKRKWQSLSLWVLTKNLSARRFYEGLGFVWDGTERTDASLIGTPLHEVRYRRRLAQIGG